MTNVMKERGINVEAEGRLIGLWREGKGVVAIAGALRKPVNTVRHRVEVLIKRGVLKERQF